MADGLRSTPSAGDIASFARPGSLRFKALMTVVLVVVAPLVWVWGTSVWDAASRMRMTHDLGATANAVARDLRSGNDAPATMARNNRVRIRVYTEQGQLVSDDDHEGSQRWHDRFTDLFYGPEGRPEPSEVDAARPSPLERMEFLTAQKNGRAQHCEVGIQLLVCGTTQRVKTPAGTVWLHVQSSQPRSTRTLYADRFQMLQLTLYVLLFSIPLTILLGTRWVRPMESLRDQALERTQGAVSTDPLVVDRNDEYGELADAFNTLLAAIESRNHANETFAADLAHELKNPIAAVRTAAEALQPGKPLTEKRAARLHRILSDSSQRMAVVIDRFLELARAEAGLTKGEREPVDLAAMAGGLLDSHRADERYAAVTFRLNAGGACVVHGTEERIETALRNLVGNAASFAGDGGTVTVTVGAVPQGYRVTVKDTGPGIAQADLDQVFDRYFSKRQGGTGLGLALSKAIVQAHGGTLSVASPPGEGASFTMVLPG